jgi:hypothetical protein
LNHRTSWIAAAIQIKKGEGIGAEKDRRSSLATVLDRYHPLRLSRLYVR